MDDAFAREFRRTCRERTRQQVLNLDSSKEAAAQMYGMSPEFLQEVIDKSRETLESQREPDGTLDIVTCECGAKNRLPSSAPARCGRCKVRLQ